jgi:hypothetical protein
MNLAVCPINRLTASYCFVPGNIEEGIIGFDNPAVGYEFKNYKGRASEAWKGASLRMKEES